MKHILILLIIGSQCHAQLSPEQKITDFLGIASTYDRLYAPLSSANESSFTPLKVKPWLELVRNTRSDGEFYRLCLTYLARFGNVQDTLNIGGPAPLTQATLGFTVNYYDETLLIDSIDRSALPSNRFPFQVGDQLISVNERTIDSWVDTLMPFVPAVNPRIKKISAASLIVNVPNPFLPSAPQPGDKAVIKVQRQNGNVEQYTLDWQVQGPSPAQFAPLKGQLENPPVPGPLAQTYSRRGVQPNVVPVFNEAGLAPVFQLPDGFQQRLGSKPSDSLFSGIYRSGGYRIGFLRIGTFSPMDTAAAMQQLTAEIQYLNQNTDGLVLDLMRNPGGDANYQDQVAQLLFPTPFNVLSEELRPSQYDVQMAAGSLVAAQQMKPPDDALVTHVQQLYHEISEAYSSGRRLTSPLLLRNTSQTLPPAQDQSGSVIAYSKPILLLIDEFTACGAEAFAAIFQDNKRGPVVGETTLGVGGAVILDPGGPFSETVLSITRTLFVRPSATGTAAYIQNSGVTPNVSLEYMTTPNLRQGGQPFVNAFTSLVVSQIGATISR